MHLFTFCWCKTTDFLHNLLGRASCHARWPTLTTRKAGLERSPLPRVKNTSTCAAWRACKANERLFLVFCFFFVVVKKTAILFPLYLRNIFISSTKRRCRRRLDPHHGRVSWSFSAALPYPIIAAFVLLFSFAGLLLSTTTSRGMSGGGAAAGGPKNGDEYTKINKFFGRFAPNTAGEGEGDSGSEVGGEVETITSSGNYFDEKRPMDGKVRFDREGKGSAIFPPPFDSSHASNIIALPDSGDLLCAWFSGDAEGGDGVAIVVARLPRGSDQWTAPKVVSRAKNRSAQNPVMFLNADGTAVNLLHTSQAGD